MALWHSAWGSTLVLFLHSFLPWGAAVLLLVSTGVWRSSPGLTAFVAGWGSHIVIDMLTHRSDGYPIFWPLSDYRFPTPVSYWEPAYHGRVFSFVSDGVVVILLVRLAARPLRGLRAETPSRHSQRGTPAPTRPAS